MNHRYIIEDVVNHSYFGPFDNYGDAYTWASDRSGLAIHKLIEVPSSVDLRNRIDADLDDQFAIMS